MLRMLMVLGIQLHSVKVYMLAQQVKEPRFDPRRRHKSNVRFQIVSVHLFQIG